MTTTLHRSSTRSRPSLGDGAADAETPVVSLDAPTRRRPSWVVAGVVLVAMAALLGAYVFNAATDTIRIVVAADTLAPGESIGADDLRVVELGRTGDLRAITAEQQELVIGWAPRAEIPAGTVLNTSLFVPTSEVVTSGKVVVGASFGAGAIPTASMSVGQTVRVIIVGTDGLGAVGAGDDPPDAVVLGDAAVWSIEGAASDNVANETWLSLLLDADLQTDFAQAAAQDRIRLALVDA